MAKEFAITDESLDQFEKEQGTKKEQRTAEEFMKENKYGVVLAYLVDYLYRLEIKPDRAEMVKIINDPKNGFINEGEKEINTRKINSCINQLIEEGLVSEGEEKNSLVIHGYRPIRLGRQICEFCGNEMEHDRQYITKKLVIKEYYKCPKCEGKAVFEIQGKAEDEGRKE